ncbi:C-terminal processing peptidase-3, Serine peptidase, MEROPS family S41A [Chlorobium phaeobacteroides DSM 266]|uniref:C-terminal processing peptidase-3, Serine peptidase, MEROPS family S41A n=2 Tax=Chlorobium phaeobacteroides TaxID=1096 RepID=A1BCI5_CHLPD|nr:C-terminal processing peptidase-3, Serine peptidase, MEROPS family S41A [Chlorobium phaeobacteroides DSM 266]
MTCGKHMRQCLCRALISAGAASLLFVIVPVLGIHAAEHDKEYAETGKSIELFGHVVRELSEKYVDTVDVGKLIYIGIDGVLESLDPYTVFLDAGQSEELGEITSGQYAGIGLGLSKFGGAAYVTSVVEGYPAWKAGIRTGDRIMAINGVSLSKSNIDNLREMIKGPAGGSLTVKIEREKSGRPPAPETVTLVRQAVHLNTVSFAGIVDGVAYIVMDSFSAKSAEELSAALQKLMKESEPEGRSLKGVVLDLRGNPGGLLTSAIDVAGLFVEKGSEVLSIRGRHPEDRQAYTTQQSPFSSTIPLVVLIDGQSASASEIVSGAIQDLDRGIIIGERSFGKGLVQSIVELPFNYSIKLTTAKYYTPSGRLIQKDLHSETELIKEGDVPPAGKEKRAKVYYTAKKRSVYGGGGILPDISVSAVMLSEYEKALVKDGLIFRFAISYHSEHAEQPTLPLDHPSLLLAFDKFLEDQKFSYTSQPEQEFEKLRTLLIKETPSDGNSEASALLGMKEEIVRRKRLELSRNREHIARLLELEILRHYSETGAKRAGLHDDPVVRTALELLSDKKRYSGILSR